MNVRDGRPWDPVLGTAHISAVPRKLKIGINYMWAWNKYGVYFGSGDPELSRWPKVLKENLRHFRVNLGMRHVRIFMYCNLNNFGSVEHREGTYTDYMTVLPDKGSIGLFVSEFAEMLNVFKDQQMQVIPSLVDFGAAVVPLEKHRKGLPSWLGHNGAGARREVWSNPKKREQFFDLALEPLLDASMSFESTIYAWELMNEPVWATSPDSRFTMSSLSEAQMNAFLKSGHERIAKRKLFKTTVGHRLHADLSNLECGDLRQFHYYPRGDEKLLKLAPLTDGSLASYDPLQPAFIGEFGVGPMEKWEKGQWPDVERRLQEDPRSRTFYRLKHIEDKGYRLALVWPDLGGSVGATDRKLSAEVEQAIVDFQAS